jgi:4-hydroxy-tetrahydrodipicolinate synthase
MYEVFRGVIPAAIMPFDASFEIDEHNFRRHLRHLAGTDGVTAVAVNGDAGEVLSLSPEEQAFAVRVAVDEIGDQVRVLCGVADPSAAAAVRTATMAQDAGAHGLLVFPSLFFAHGARLRADVVHAFYGKIASSTDLPMVLFVDAATSPKNVPAPLLAELCLANENITGIKDWSVDILAYEANLRAVRSLDRPVSMLTSFSRALLPTLALGADGILSGHGSLIADVQVQLFREVESGNLKAARDTADRIYDLTQVFYAAPVIDQFNRMKEGLKVLGRIDEAYSRPPVLPVSPAERSLIHDAVRAAGLS